MTKYKLLYFVSEDEYFLTHKIDQAKSLLKNNFDVLVACNFDKNEKRIKSHGFKTRNIGFDRRSINPFKEFFYLIKLISIIVSFKPDFIQCIALKPILYMSIISKFLRKSKMIFCVVGLGYLFIDTKKTTEILKLVYLKLINLFLVKNKVLFVFQNKEDCEMLEKSKVSNFSNTTIIRGSGVNTKRFKSKKIKKIYDVIFHSRILYDKGFLEFINAIRDLKKKKKISVLVLGIPDKNNRASIENHKLKEWAKEKLIIWKGKKKNVIPFLQKSRIAVLPSYREGLPKTLLEAASCEIPIITTDVVGCRDICLNNFNGILVPPKDHVSLSQAIEKILNNPDLAKFYGKNGRKLVLEKFSNKIIEKEFLKAYKTLI